MKTIPVCFVTGFLGSGKTTFIEKLVTRLGSKKIVYLINEFSPKDVDGQRLSLKDGELVKIPGGSIFCKCLTSQFLKVLTQISELDIDGVVIEASGIANPRVAGDMLKETGLDQFFSITSIIAVVDPRSFLKLCRTLPNIKEQVAASTHILINKVDKFEREKVEQTIAAVIELNSTAVLEETTFCASEVDVFAAQPVIVTGGEYAKCKDPNFCERRVRIESVAALEKLKRKLGIFGDELYRVKGCIEQDDGTTLVVDYDGNDWFERSGSGSVAGEAGEMVVIASGYKEGALEVICGQFA